MKISTPSSFDNGGQSEGQFLVKEKFSPTCIEWVMGGGALDLKREMSIA